MESYPLDPSFYIRAAFEEQGLWFNSLDAAPQEPPLKTALDLRRARRKILAALGYNGGYALFPFHEIQNPLLPEFIEGILRHRIKPFIQINGAQLKALCHNKASAAALKSFLLKMRPAHIGLNIVSSSLKNIALLNGENRILRAFPSWFITYIVLKANRREDLPSIQSFRLFQTGGSGGRAKGALWKAHLSSHYRKAEISAPEGLSITSHEPKFERIELYFPYKMNFFDPYLSPAQVYQFLKRHQRHGHFPFSGDIYDERRRFDDMEPLLQPFAKTPARQAIDRQEPPASPQKEAESEASPKNEAGFLFSIIIPSYNRKKELLRSLAALLKLQLPQSRFEIIIVDDGSSDGTREELRRFLLNAPDVAITAFHFPRLRPKKAGGEDFRAGLARNIGAAHSKGKYLLFLDSDILIPPNALQALAESLQKGDLVQMKRYHLAREARSPSAPQSQKRAENSPALAAHLQKAPRLPKALAAAALSASAQAPPAPAHIEDSGYWGPFYEKGFSAGRASQAPWKYVCSYGLACKREDFFKMGRFSRAFAFYGFEDTDLGYRFFKAGKRLLLSDLKCFHQFISAKEREDRKSEFRRRKLLSRTAQIFFLKRQGLSIFEELRPYMRPLGGISYYLPPFFKKRGWFVGATARRLLPLEGF